MKKYFKLKKHTVPFWLRIFLYLLLLFFLFVLFFVQRITRDNLQEQSILNLNYTMKIYSDKVDEKINSLETYLYYYFSDSEAVVRIEYGGSEMQIFQAKREILKNLQEIETWDYSIYNLFFYSPVNEDQIMISTASSSRASVSRTLTKQIKDYVDTNYTDARAPKKGYLVVNIEGNAYIISLYKIRNSFVGTCLLAKELIYPLTSINPQNSIAFLAAKNGTIYEASSPIGNTIDLSMAGKFIDIQGKNYLLAKYLSADGNFYYGLLTISTQIEKQSAMIGKIILVVFFVLMGFTTLVILLASRFIGKPLYALTEVMNKVGEGDWDTLLEMESYISENDQLIKSFNSMIGEIKNLKLSNYEYETSEQKLRLQYLQMQVNPHFYLNALNIIYSLAEIKDYEKIQIITLSLVKYSRYMFKDATELVTVCMEMEHVDNYLAIQQIRFSNRINYKKKMEDDIMDALLPPFVIQSFVENSIKYAIDSNRKCSIQVMGEKIYSENKYFVRIEIQDNGEGYSDEVINLINAYNENPERRIGIRNVMQRLEIIFGDRASITLENDNGAKTVLIIPFISKREE